MFSGLFIAYSIWKYDGTDTEHGRVRMILLVLIRDYFDNGVSSFRDDFINTGDNDWWIGKWWDYIMYLGFPIMFSVLILSYLVI